MNSFVNDLQYAKTVGVAVKVMFINGDEFLAGVHEVSADEGFVSFHRPQHMQDHTTTQKVAFDLIGAITVTDVTWGNS